MDFLLHLFNTVNTYSKTNPLMAGALSLWGLGVVTWICKGIPKWLWEHIERQFTTTLTFTNDTVGTNNETFGNFMHWFESNAWIRLSRSMSLQGGYGSKDNGTTIGMGPGKHYFKYRGRLMWLNRERLTTGGTTYQINYEITITTLGRNRQLLVDMISEFIYRPKNDRIGIYTWNDGEWVRTADIRKRGLQTVIIAQDVKSKLMSTIDEFRGSRAWYENRGLPYKLTYLLHGIPGCGKTSLIKALASHYEMSLAVLNLMSMNDERLEHALSSAPDNCIVVIEDFDSAGATKARRGLSSKTKSKPKPLNGISSGKRLTPVKADDDGAEQSTPMDVMSGWSMLSLTGILNALDGIVSLDNKILFLTTNVREELDQALIRKGRIDHTIELKALEHVEVLEYIELMFPGHPVDYSHVYDTILGCDLQDLYFEHRHDEHTFVNAIPHREHVSTNQLHNVL
jgi:chaperone BCS1